MTSPIAERMTRIARVQRTADGIVIVRIAPGIDQTLADAKENVAVSVELGGGGRCALVTDIREARPLAAETRHYYTGKTLTDFFVAIAILVKATPLGRMMGNVYLRVAKPGIPSQLFADEQAALEWLKGQIAAR